MKSIPLYAFLLFIMLTACKKDDGFKTVSERIKKVWRAKTVKENATIVYAEGAANNAMPGYANFLLDLHNADAAILKEFNGDSFTGKWQLQNDILLKLINLSPQPTGTNGTIEYNIVSITDTELVISSTTASVKTGNTINEYTLRSQ